MQFDQHVLQYHLYITILISSRIIQFQFIVLTLLRFSARQKDNEIQAAWKVAGRNEMERCMCLLSDTITCDVRFALLAG